MRFYHTDEGDYFPTRTYDPKIDGTIEEYAKMLERNEIVTQDILNEFAHNLALELDKQITKGFKDGTI